MGVTEELTQFVTRVKFEDLPADVIAEAKRQVTECACTFVFGSSLPLGKVMCDALYKEWEPSEAIFIGTNKRGSVKTAALYKYDQRNFTHMMV